MNSKVDFTGGYNSKSAVLRVTESDGALRFEVVDILGGKREVMIHKVEAQILFQQMESWLEESPLDLDDLASMLQGSGNEQ